VKQAPTAGDRPQARLARQLKRLVPARYADLEGSGRTLARTFGVALAIRLILMPIALHGDLLSSYHRSWIILTEFRLYRLLPHEIIQVPFLWLYSLFLPMERMVVWGGDVSVTPEFWIGTFANDPLVHPALFLLKLPFLLGDFAVALILLRLFADRPGKGLRAAAMWLLNPITIFTFYVFGRHDVFAILFIALGLLAFDRSKLLRGALSIGVAIWSRYYPALLLPFLVAVQPGGWSGGGWKKRLRIIAVALLPLAVYNAVSLLDVDETLAGSPIPSARMATSRFSSYLLRFNFDMGNYQVLFIFPMLYVMLCALALALPPRENPVVRFCSYAICCLCLLYATTFFHPQYFAWIVLFMVILRANESDRVLSNLHYCQVLLFFPYTFFWRQELFGRLLAPLDPVFFANLASPWVWIGSFGSPEILVNLARTVLSAICLVMVGWILLDGRKRVAESA
jgi:hypothetical protein